MEYQSSTYNQNSLSNWLLRLILICSVFTFSGFVVSAQEKRPQIIQTEWLLDENDLQNQQIRSFQVVDSESITRKEKDSSYSLKFALSTFNKLIIVTFSSQKIQSLTIQIPTFFILMRTNSHHSDDEYSPLS